MQTMAHDFVAILNRYGEQVSADSLAHAFYAQAPTYSSYTFPDGSAAYKTNALDQPWVVK